MSIVYSMILTFTVTGASQSYTFADKANCEAAMPAVYALYKAHKKPITLECRPRVSSLRETDSSSTSKKNASSSNVRTRHKVTYKL